VLEVVIFFVCHNIWGVAKIQDLSNKLSQTVGVALTNSFCFFPIHPIAWRPSYSCCTAHLLPRDGPPAAPLLERPAGRSLVMSPTVLSRPYSLLTSWATRSQLSSRPARRYTHLAAFAARASGDEARAPDLTATARAAWPHGGVRGA
jgi:hypothetical protein